MIAAKRFRYRGTWVVAGAEVNMSPGDERAHRLLGLVTDGPIAVSAGPDAVPSPKRHRKKK